MGLISALKDSAGGVMADQWREYFYCDSMSENILATKASRRVSDRSSNTKGMDNVISNGSVIAVADGQCMLLVDQGRITELCAEPGEFIYDSSTEPSFFYGSLGKNILDTLKNMGTRFTFGGEAPKDQRVYYINTKEIMGNKYGIRDGVPFRVVDEGIGLDIEINLMCHGEYSYRISDPALFYKNVCGNIAGDYNRSRLDSTLKGEMGTALPPAISAISAMGVRYYELSAHTMELTDKLNEVLSSKWRALRGIEVVSCSLNAAASEEDREMLTDLRRKAVYRNANMAAAHLVDSQAEAMKAAASNTNAGPAMAFMGMNMAQQAGGTNAAALFQMGQQQAAAAPAPAAPAAAPAPAAPAAGGWKCACGMENTGKFCVECGAKKPEEGWKCACGAVNKGKFCPECGAKKPAGVPQYRCDKCGWEPEDPKNPPRFCPECGDPFNEGDVK